MVGGTAAAVPDLRPIAWTALWVAVHLAFDGRGRRRLAAAAKALASAGFVAAALLAARALPDPIARPLVAATALCAAGDVLLALEGRGPFLAGTAVFAAGHGAYALAFVGAARRAGGGDPVAAVVAAGAVIVLGVAVLRRIAAVQPRWLVAATAGYVVAIAGMVGTAFALAADAPAVAAGAAAFALSDVSVAEDRLVRPRFVHRLWGIPLYYAAQYALVAGAAA